MSTLNNYFISSKNIKCNYSDNITKITQEFQEKGIKISVNNIHKEYKEKFKKKISVMYSDIN